MPLGKLGVHFIPDGMSARATVEFAQLVEEQGFDTLWVPEFLGRDVFAHSAFLLANTRSLVIGSGIANIYARDPRAMVAGQMALSELFGGRFVLGVGVSHPEMVSGVRGHVYGKPVATLRTYLTQMQTHSERYAAPKPAERPTTIVAALRPRMLELSAELADGAMPTWSTPEHTYRARQILGPRKLLCVLQNVMLETNPAKARVAIRTHIGMAMQLTNYQENLKWLGFVAEDFQNGCSDRLVDAVVAWGDESAIRRRLDEHFAAGADHVCIYPQHPNPKAMLDLDTSALKVLGNG